MESGHQTFITQQPRGIALRVTVPLTQMGWGELRIVFHAPEARLVSVADQAIQSNRAPSRDPVGGNGWKGW